MRSQKTLVKAMDFPFLKKSHFATYPSKKSPTVSHPEIRASRCFYHFCTVEHVLAAGNNENCAAEFVSSGTGTREQNDVLRMVFQALDISEDNAGYD
jgi:hypothetical protein